MKSYQLNLSHLVLFLVGLATLFFIGFAVAQDAAPVLSTTVVDAVIPPPETLQDFTWLDSLLKFLVDLAAKYPMLSTILMVIGLLRVVNKPLFSVLKTIVASTSTKKDDELLGKVEKSYLYNMISYILDWFGSIKLKK